MLVPSSFVFRQHSRVNKIKGKWLSTGTAWAYHGFRTCGLSEEYSETAGTDPVSAQQLVRKIFAPVTDYAGSATACVSPAWYDAFTEHLRSRLPLTRHSLQGLLGFNSRSRSSCRIAPPGGCTARCDVRARCSVGTMKIIHRRLRRVIDSNLKLA